MLLEIFALLFLGFAALAVDKPAVVSISPMAPIEAEAGTTVHVQIIATVKDGYHVQANPPSDEYRIPTKLDLAAPDGIIFGSPVYPIAESHRLQGADQELSTYSGRFSIDLPITVNSKLTTGNLTLKGSLRYQACDSRRCLPPASVPIDIVLQLTHANAPADAQQKH